MADNSDTDWSSDTGHLADVIEKLGAIALYLQTDMGHHSDRPTSRDGDAARDRHLEGTEEGVLMMGMGKE